MFWLCLVRPAAFRLKADKDATGAAWFNIKDLPDLAFVHIEIINKTIQRLKAKKHIRAYLF